LRYAEIGGAAAIKSAVHRRVPAIDSAKRRFRSSVWRCIAYLRQ